MKDNHAIQVNVVLVILILLGISTRFFLHIPNFTAIGAIALFSGAYFSRKTWAFLVPLSLLFITDLFLGLHKTLPFVYASFVMIILMGRLISRRKNWKSVMLASLSGSFLFYLITNFGVWIMGMGLSPDLAGVYRDGIPFFRNMIAGDLFFNAVLFGSAYLIFEKFRLFQPADVR